MPARQRGSAGYEVSEEGWMTAVATLQMKDASERMDQALWGQG